MHIFALYEAVASRDWEASEREYDAGLKWVQEHEPEKELFWNCQYQRALFAEGRAYALDNLRQLVAKNKDKYLPLRYLAACLVDLREYDEAVKCYQEAALLAEPNRRASIDHVNRRGAVAYVQSGGNLLPEKRSPVRLKSIDD